MPLKDRIRMLTTPTEVDAFLKDHPRAVIFKAGTCHKTDEALSVLQPLLGDREDIPFGFIRVVENRPASNHVAALTGIRHESPQILFFQDGRAVFDRDNWDITPEDVETAVREHCPRPAEPQAK